MSRSFTIESVVRNGKKVKYDGGRYMSETPSNAARKVFTQVYRYLNLTGKLSLTIQIRETTQGSNHKIYKYRVTRVAKSTEAYWLPETIIFKYTTKVKAV